MDSTQLTTSSTTYIRRSMSSQQLTHPKSSSAMSMITAKLRSSPGDGPIIATTPPSPIRVWAPAHGNYDYPPERCAAPEGAQRKPSLLSQHLSGNRNKTMRNVKSSSSNPFLPMEFDDDNISSDGSSSAGLLGLPISPSSPSSPFSHPLRSTSPPTSTTSLTHMDTSNQEIPKSHQQRAEQSPPLSTTVKSSSLNALNAFNDHHQYQLPTPSSLSQFHKQSSSLSSTKDDLPVSPIPSMMHASRANKTRNAKRAAHAKAVIEDLIDSCTALAIAESQTNLAASTTNLKLPDATDDRELIYNAIAKHLKSLPLRYALSIEHPSEVLLHMRLMNAARATKFTAAIHIAPIDPNDLNNTFSTLHLSQTCACADNASLKRITVSGADASGLLEFITRVLSTETSRVLDADVMLSSDSIALDRFLVNYQGRLRLDKLKGVIEDFLKSKQVPPPPATANRPAPVPSAPQPIPPPPPTAPRSSPNYNSATPTATNPLFVETDNNFLLDDDQITEADFQMSEPLSKVLGLPVDIDVDEDKGVHLKDLHVLEKIFERQSSAIFKGIWRKGRSNNSHHHHHHHSHHHNHHYHKSKLVAIKATSTCGASKTATSKDLQELRREGEIAAPFKHENICRLLGAVELPHTHCLLYEFCSGGSLHSFLIDTDLPYECLSIALDIANGMAYLHSHDIIHRDLKSTNVLLDGNGRAKIADFGLSVLAPRSGQELTAETGTYRWMAPEVIRHESYSSNADVYSFGIVLWQLITREVPFASLSPIQAAFMVAKEDRRPKIPSNTEEGLARLVHMCWHGEQQTRPSFYYVVQMLASMIRDCFNPFNVSLKTVVRAESALVNAQGNSTVNVDAGVSLVGEQDV
ncbi:hypothetical protein TrCOL_g9246 [Triparma columacea]|uniref:TKL protein kinase n=1 Tax=Triparma columacea TaxID=722753 RepID=A0A9W7GFU5_9STRA|nr:hypothetical protein TrCOL_g9246 [Triparma columacea]